MDNITQLQKRFNIEIDANKAKHGLVFQITNLSKSIFHDLWYGYPRGSLPFKIVIEICKYLMIDHENYFYYDELSEHEINVDEFHSKIFNNNSDLNEIAYNLQIYINVLYGLISNKENVIDFTAELRDYLNVFPIIGLKIYTYEDKPPQVFPRLNKKSNELIETTFGILEDNKLEKISEGFEQGLKVFITASKYHQLKDVVEDMSGTLDELAKHVLTNNNNGFKHIFDKGNPEKFGLNNTSKEIFKNLKTWMENIKHGQDKEIDRDDVEMIINLTSSLIILVINKKTNDNN